MEVLAGVIIGVVVALSILRKPITINLNTKHETILPDPQQIEVHKELNKAGTPEDKVYEEKMTGLLEEVNKFMTGDGIDV